MYNFEMDRKSLEKMTNSSVPSNRIAKGLWFQSEYQKYCEQRDKDFSKTLRNAFFHSSDLKVNYRNINHWDTSNLLTLKSSADADWRKFSLLDIAWIKTVASLREFGLPIKKIKNLKKSLFEDKSDFDGLPSKVFEFYIHQILMDGEDGYIIVFEDGSGDVATRDDLVKHFSRFGMPNHVAISIKSVLKKSFAELDDFLFLESLGDKEKKLLIAVLARDYESIEINCKNGELIKYEKRKRQKLGDKPYCVISNLIKEDGYQDIELKKENGKVVSVVSKKKHML